MPTGTLARPAVTLYRHTPARISYPPYPGTPRSSSARTDQRCQKGRWRARSFLFTATRQLAFRIPPTRERRGPPRPAQSTDANRDVGAPGRYSLPLHAISLSVSPYPGAPRSSSARTDQQCQRGRWRAQPLLFTATRHLATCKYRARWLMGKTSANLRGMRQQPLRISCLFDGTKQKNQSSKCVNTLDRYVLRGVATSGVGLTLWHALRPPGRGRAGAQRRRARACIDAKNCGVGRTRFESISARLKRSVAPLSSLSQNHT